MKRSPKLLGIAIIAFIIGITGHASAEDAQTVTLLEFFDRAPMVIKQIDQIPSEVAERWKWPQGVTIGLFVCSGQKDPYRQACDGTVKAIPFSEVREITRDRNRASVNLNNEPQHTAWVVKLKSGAISRHEIPPIPLPLSAKDIAGVSYVSFLLMTARNYSPNRLIDSMGFAFDVPATEVDPVTGATSMATVPIRSLSSLRQVSAADAAATIETYREKERNRVAEQQKRDEERRQQQLRREELERQSAQAARDERLARDRAAEEHAAKLRKSLRVGDYSHCGLVVEIKRPIVKIETMIGERWLRIEQIYATGDKPCVFQNGVYQDP